jgi:hypothetical protein
VAICADHGVARLEEQGDPAFPDGADVPLLHQRFAAGRREEDPLPTELSALPPDQVIEIPDAEFSLWERDLGHADWRSDATAGDGVAAWMPGDHERWCLEARLDDRALGDATWTAYVVARVDRDAGAAADAPGIGCGIYDREARKAVCERVVPAADLADGYRLQRVGSFTRGGDRYVWVAPPAKPGIRAVWIDRVVLVRGERP